MEKRVLVAYASTYGSTGEVAMVVAETLSGPELRAEVMPARDVTDLSPYTSVVLGTSIRMEKPLKEAMDFAGRHRAALADMPVAVFSTGLYMREDTPENREKTRGFLAPLLAMLPDPVGLAFFAGKLEHANLNFLFRLAARHDKTGFMREGDWRDWNAIREWSQDLAARLKHLPRPPI